MLYESRKIEDRPRMIRKFEVNIGEGIILAFSYDDWDEYGGDTCTKEGSQLRALTYWVNDMQGTASL